MTNHHIKEIINRGKVIAIIYSKNLRPNGIQFLTPQNYPLQIGLHDHKKGKIVAAHYHPHLKYKVVNTQEFLYVEKGVVQMEIFTKNWKRKAKVKLIKGDFILIVDAGHSVNMLPGSRVVEVKQGPYPGDKKAKIFRDSRPFLPHDKGETRPLRLARQKRQLVGLAKRVGRVKRG